MPPQLKRGQSSMKFTMFTDENGKKWEVTGEHGKTDGSYVIRPIVDKSKYDVSEPTSMFNGSYTFDITFPATQDQAQLIKQSVEALMEHITNRDDVNTYDNHGLIDSINKARQSIQKGAE